MARTRTGSIPIGFRRGWAGWQRDLGQLVDYTKVNDFAFLDFGPAPVEELRQVQAAGVRVGAVDLKEWRAMVSPDAGKRRAAVRANAEYVREVAALGVRVFLAAAAPEDPVRPRAENFGLAVESYGELAAAVAGLDVRIVLEGAPGPPPHFATIGCTPADLRAFLAAVGSSNVLGVNLDPSHLVRMGIDPVRFAREFAPRIHHVHAKDTELLDDGRYEHGTQQAATFAPPRGYGGHAWRYAVPGRGHVPWGAILAVLSEVGYGGLLSIELEDEQVNGQAEAEQRALVEARTFLASV